MRRVALIGDAGAAVLGRKVWGVGRLWYGECRGAVLISGGETIMIDLWKNWFEFRG